MARKSRVHRTMAPEVVDDSVLAGQYGRLSVEDGDSEEYNSIGNQKKIAIIKLKRVGLSCAHHTYIVFCVRNFDFKVLTTD